MEKEKLSDFEEYLHNKILTIYGKTDDNTEKNEQNVMGSLIIPKNIIGLINEHNNSFKKFNNYPESYLKSQNFYDNLMISLKKNKNILKNCCRISTKSGFPNLKKFSRKKHDEIQPSNFTYQVFETINKDDINNEYSENKNMDLGAIKKARPMSTKNLTNNQPVIYDSFQKKHIERINSARDLKKEDIIIKKNTIKTISNENNSNIALKRRKSKLKNFQVNEKFPAWILERSDFQNKLQSPEFNLNYKILKICEKQ